MFDAYNVGWNLQDRKRTAERLGQELVKLWHDHEFHAIGLSEIFEIEYKDETIRNDVMMKREYIRDVLLGMLNKASSRQWCARLDAHHIYMYQESLNCVEHDYVSLGVANQPWRKIQYFVFLPPGCDLPLHVYHCHCPSAGNNKARRFGTHARKTVVATLCSHMQKQHTSQQYRGVVQPDFPAVLLTGDYNLSEPMWKIGRAHV